MTGTVALVLALTAVVAVVDWIAVGSARRPLEYVAKPLTLIGLIAAALLLEPVDDAARALFVVALVLSLAGDVFLMLPNRRRFFPLGLASFLLGHLAYVPGLWLLGVSVPGLVVGFVAVLVAVGLVGLRIVRGVQDREPRLAAPVTAYVAVISLMVVSAVGTLSPFAIVGAALFYASDALIAWNEFLTPKSWARLAIMVTYHLGQLGLVLALVAS